MRTVPTFRVGRTVQHDGRQQQKADECVLWILGLIFGFAAPAFLIYQELAYHNAFDAFQEGERMVVPLHKARDGDLAHFVSSDVEANAADRAFGVSVAGALRISRNTEYCQWEETSSTRCEQCHDAVRNTTVDCNCVTTYYYAKTWRSHRILSVGFDQPGAHHNPQRDPFPSATFTAEDATAKVPGVGVVRLGLEVLQRTWADWRFVDWTLRAVPQPSFFQRWSPWPDTTRYEDISQLRGADSSLAARTERFVYVGQGGYFFSPYQGSTAGFMFNYFVQYLEGSLLDWQLGDLMPSCTAGDIRVSFSVQDPKEISVAGKVSGLGSVPDQPIWIGLHTTSHGHSLALLHAGFKSFKSMADTEIQSYQWWCVGARLVFAGWAHFVANRFGLDTAAPKGRWWLGAFGVWALGLGLLWAALWGPGLRPQAHALATPLLLAAGAAALVLGTRPLGKVAAGAEKVARAKEG